MTLPTLSEFFVSHFTPIWIQARSLDPKTHSSYGESLKLWKKLTSDPPLDLITEEMIREFSLKLKSHPGKKKSSVMMPASIAKHLRQLETVLQLAGPRNRSNPQGQKLLSNEEVFFTVPKVKHTKKERSWRIDEVRAMYAAADIMTRPLGADSPDFWRGVVVIGYFCGLRVYALTHVKFSDMTVTPDERWLDAPDEISKGKRGIRCWLPQLAVDHIERLRPLGHAEILHVPKFDTRRRFLYEDIEKLQQHAGIDPKRRFRFHSFRATYATGIGNSSRTHREDTRLAQLGCGHSSSAITLGHYLSGSEEMKALAEATERMLSPIPPQVEVAVSQPAPVPLNADFTRPRRSIIPVRWSRAEEFID